MADGRLPVRLDIELLIVTRYYQQLPATTDNLPRAMLPISDLPTTMPPPRTSQGLPTPPPTIQLTSISYKLSMGRNETRCYS